MARAKHELAALCAHHERELRNRYGSLLTIEDVAQVLRYRSAHAVRKARNRGSLPVPMIQLPPRLNWFAPVAGVATFLAKLDVEANAAKEATMT